MPDVNAPENRHRVDHQQGQQEPRRPVRTRSDQQRHNGGTDHHNPNASIYEFDVSHIVVCVKLVLPLSQLICTPLQSQATTVPWSETLRGALDQKASPGAFGVVP
jgi:hypothetical protein